MSLRELAELMLGLGASESVNLDGGGSTAMVIAGQESGSAFRVVNRPSDRGGERAVGNAVGLVRRCVR
jgi:exopolysaccharide biosynthesis protein